MVSLHSEAFTVTANEIGAELTSVRYRGRERLWQNENGSWAGHAPILFPVCGVTAMRLGGRVYPCPRHGFARHALFSVTERSETRVRFRLLADAETTQLYPFAFRFDVVYTLLSDTLSVAYEIHNPGEGMLYASCGGHDSFALAEEAGEYALRFASRERLDSYLTDDEGRLTGRTQSLGQGRVLDLSTPLLDGGGSVCLDHLRSREVTLVRRASGETVARVAFPETDKLVLWHPAGSRMLCIEPWQTLPDTVGDTRDFSAKDGVLAVPPGQTRCVTRNIAYGDGT